MPHRVCAVEADDLRPGATVYPPSTGVHALRHECDTPTRSLLLHVCVCVCVCVFCDPSSLSLPSVVCSRGKTHSTVQLVRPYADFSFNVEQEKRVRGPLHAPHMATCTNSSHGHVWKCYRIIVPRTDTRDQQQAVVL